MSVESLGYLEHYAYPGDYQKRVEWKISFSVDQWSEISRTWGDSEKNLLDMAIEMDKDDRYALAAASYKYLGILLHINTPIEKGLGKTGKETYDSLVNEHTFIAEYWNLHEDILKIARSSMGPAE